MSPIWDTSLQVDHILPRVDVYGCPCGTNGYNNALIISGSLNRAMSNDLRHPDRIAILQEYVPGYVAPQRAPFEPSDEEADHTGGCSTHTAGSLGILGVLLALMLPRRTRKGRRLPTYVGRLVRRLRDVEVRARPAWPVRTIFAVAGSRRSTTSWSSSLSSIVLPRFCSEPRDRRVLDGSERKTPTSPRAGVYLSPADTLRRRPALLVRGACRRDSWCTA
jgi:hypothetical protein